MHAELLKANAGMPVAKVGLISIHPEFVRRIYDGSKLFEFRKIEPKGKVELFLIYETAPVKKITGYFRTTKTHVLSPQALWEKCSKNAGIDEKRFFEYYENREVGCAIAIDSFAKFKCEYSLLDLRSDLKRPPQSYQYVTLETN